VRFLAGFHAGDGLAEVCAFAFELIHASPEFGERLVAPVGFGCCRQIFALPTLANEKNLSPRSATLFRLVH
jgi:hypothetical protein